MSSFGQRIVIKKLENMKQGEKKEKYIRGEMGLKNRG